MSENVCGEPCPKHPEARCIVARLPPKLRGAFGDADEPHPHIHVYDLSGDAGVVIHSWGRAERYVVHKLVGADKGD